MVDRITYVVLGIVLVVAIVGLFLVQTPTGKGGEVKRLVNGGADVSRCTNILFGCLGTCIIENDAGGMITAEGECVGTLWHFAGQPSCACKYRGVTYRPQPWVKRPPMLQPADKTAPEVSSTARQLPEAQQCSSFTVTGVGSVVTEQCGAVQKQIAANEPVAQGKRSEAASQARTNAIESCTKGCPTDCVNKGLLTVREEVACPTKISLTITGTYLCQCVPK